MSTSTAIYSIAKDLNVESSRVIKACKSLGIKANGATKKLNNNELEKVKTYFETGKNASEEIIHLNKSQPKSKNKVKKAYEEKKINYFPNRLVGKH